MGWFLSRSWVVAAAMFFSLCIIPVAILGFMGWVAVPMDIISTPGANIAIGMGVDAMVHMVIYVHKRYPHAMLSWTSWREATLHLWRPIFYTAIIISAGFGIFTLSHFPPTQRFGLMVVIGAVIAPLATLVSLTTIVSFGGKVFHKNQEKNFEEPSPLEL